MCVHIDSIIKRIKCHCCVHFFNIETCLGKNKRIRGSFEAKLNTLVTTTDYNTPLYKIHADYTEMAFGYVCLMGYS